MKKNINCILVIIILIALILPITNSYAKEKDEKTENQSQFFEISKLEVSKNEEIEMTINLEEIEYNKFEFKLESSENISNVEISNENKTVNNDETLELEKENNEIIIEIDKKITNLNTITLYYKIQETLQINDTIKFIATITNKEDNQNEIENSNEVEKQEVKEKETQTVEFEVKIIEEKEENTNKTENEENEEDKNETENDQKEENINIPENKEQQNITANNNGESKQSETNNKSEIAETSDKKSNGNTLEKNNSNSIVQISGTNITSTSSQKSEQTITYNGSDNNYLSELSINGYALNKEFSKDNLTYFVTVESDINSLDIIANKEDDSATVCIYGNENLDTEINKILISVTAENGNVRNYRIYVTKNS